MSERLRGRLGVAQRTRRLRNEPLCRDCKSAGLVRLATVVDHVVPLALGGLDVDTNCRSLCDDCHKVRTAEQFNRTVRPTTGADGWPVGS